MNKSTTVGLEHIHDVGVENRGLEEGEGLIKRSKAVLMSAHSALIVPHQACMREGPLHWGGLHPGKVQVTLLEGTGGLVRPRMRVYWVISTHRRLERAWRSRSHEACLVVTLSERRGWR